MALLPNEPVVEIFTESQMSFDVSVKFNDGEKVDLEMQARNQAYDYSSRAEIQVARLLSTSNIKGDNWTTPAAYQISVLNFSLDKSDKSCLSWYTMKDEMGKSLSNRLNVIFFDLVKNRKLINTPVEKLSKLEKWGLFLSYADSEKHAGYIRELVDSEGGLMNARSSLLTVSQDEINWARQNSIYIAQHDYNDGLYNAEKRGERKRALEAARRFLQMGLPIEQIAQGVGLSISEIQQLKN